MRQKAGNFYASLHYLCMQIAGSVAAMLVKGTAAVARPEHRIGKAVVLDACT
jgi:hypothetical protein